MSKTRQAHACPPLPSAVTALSFDFNKPHLIPIHFHPEDQLVYATRGVMRVETDDGIWVVPPQRAVWIPAKVAHRVRISGKVSMRTLYFRARLVPGLPRSCRVLNVSPLLRELILHACVYSKLNRRREEHAHLIDMILDQLRTIEAVPLQLPMPSDARALRVVEALNRDGNNDASLDRICRESGASRRTIERLFRQETHITLGKWRQQMRLLHSLQHLADGQKITRVALEAGYSTPSAFVAMFKGALGITPSRYFRDAARG